MGVSPNQTQRATVRPYLSFLCALLLLRAFSGAAWAGEPELVIEHDWSFHVGDYAFGFVQYAWTLRGLGTLRDFSVPPTVISESPRTTKVLFGPQSWWFSDRSALPLAAEFAAIVALVVMSTGLLVRLHRRAAPPPPEP